MPSALKASMDPPNERSTLKLASWDWHPNTEGHALLAERIHQELLQSRRTWRRMKTRPVRYQSDAGSNDQ